MANDGGGSPHDLVVQTWIMYSIAILLFLVRLFARYKRLGFRFQVEDYLMVVAVGFYTAFAVTNIYIIEGGGSNLYEPPSLYYSFSASEIAARVRGSKIEFASENCQLCTIYSLKACMLLVHFRLTSNLWQHRLVKVIAGYTLIGWITTELVLFLNCRPLSGYWTLPPPHKECSTYFRYEVVQCVFNISSDIFILCVILPMFIRAKMPWKTKLPVIVVFSMGIVVIACAIISKYFTFYNIYDDSYQFWYLREASIGMYVTNLPFVWSLARSTLTFLRTSQYTNKGRYNEAQYGTDHASNARWKSGVHSRSTRNMPTIYDTRTGRADGIMRTESEENIIEMGGVGHVTNKSTASTGSDNTEWAQANGHDDFIIRKTTEIVIQKD
ncbi:UbiD family decarboxylase [Aspergillus piperis CBS 112811]|uniref:UbiD family decarboxylase n=2 Tax=Aspergillus subgen. Circumdati TaxID=2720871 RepID=A0A8G1VGB7_9EURO|nr:UbiD family decarboxylase [Aspergillus piperis CBS 112811]OJZ88988.1 hypothetical protein ASPFODRAFT_127282 [Aspergillus luchuensis CBS 106.47]RAH52144.1 UbiD family decarboxylase [Aspergillus piperis CBS 112811]